MIVAPFLLNSFNFKVYVYPVKYFYAKQIISVRIEFWSFLNWKLDFMFLFFELMDNISRKKMTAYAEQWFLWHANGVDTFSESLFYVIIYTLIFFTKLLKGYLCVGIHFYEKNMVTLFLLLDQIYTLQLSYLNITYTRIAIIRFLSY